MEFSREVTREQATLAASGRGVSRHRVHEHADSGGKRRIGALGEDAGNGAGQNVTSPSSSHTRIASLAQSRYPIRSAYQGPGAF
jgi:hypothetical protein